MIKNKKHQGIKSKLTGALLSIIMLILFLIYMIPFILVLINSLKAKREIIKNPLRIPNVINFDNYTKAFEKMNFFRVFANSFYITMISVLLIILLSSMLAYYFVRIKSRFNNISFALMISSMIIPFQAIMIPLVSIYGGKLGILHTRETLIFMHTGFSLSMAVFIYHGFVKGNIPISLEEAAYIDGCNRPQIFFKIVFPLLKPITSTIIILDALQIWNDYLLPSLVLTKKELLTLPLSTYSFYGTYSSDYGTIMAGLLLTIAPLLILFIFLQKYIISGVVAGAVKS